MEAQETNTPAPSSPPITVGPIQVEIKILGYALVVCLVGIAALSTLCAYIRCDLDPAAIKTFERFAEMILIAFCTAIRGPR